MANFAVVLHDQMTKFRIYLPRLTNLVIFFPVTNWRIWGFFPPGLSDEIDFFSDDKKRTGLKGNVKKGSPVLKIVTKGGWILPPTKLS